MRSGLRLLLDENIHDGVLNALQAQGVDAVHVRGIGLSGRPDNEILDAAREDDRILVTRDVKDFMRLSRFYQNVKREFTGVLLVPASFPEKDPTLLVRAISNWTSLQQFTGGIPAGVAWLSRDLIQDGDGPFVREPEPAWIRALRRLEAAT